MFNLENKLSKRREIGFSVDQLQYMIVSNIQKLFSENVLNINKRETNGIRLYQITVVPSTFNILNLNIKKKKKKKNILHLSRLLSLVITEVF